MIMLAEGLFRAFPGASPESRALQRLSLTTVNGNPVMKQIKAQEALASLPLVDDPELGALLAPSLRLQSRTLDYAYTLQTDSFGFTNHEPWPGKIDAVVLGNSLIVGAGVGLDGQFTTLLNRRFPGRSFINLGNPGGGTESQYRIYARHAEPRNPRLVVAMLWPVWEVTNTVKFAHWLAERPNQTFTRYRLSYDNARLARDNARAKERSGLSAILWRSAVVRAGYLSAKAVTTPNPYTPQVSYPNGEVVNLSLREQLRLVRGIASPDAPDVEHLFVGPLEKLRLRVEERGGQLLVVLVPSREEIYGAPAVPAVMRIHDAIKPLLAARHLTLLDLYPLFCERSKDRPAFFGRDMHLNAFGNQLLAAAIGDWIDRSAVFQATPLQAAGDVARESH